MTILALFIVMLMDPIRLCIAVSFAFVGFKAKSLSALHWIALATISTVFVVETALHLTQPERQVFPALLVALVASLCHVLAATWVLRWIQKRRAKQS